MSQNFEDSVQNIKRTILNHNKAMPQPKNQRVIKFDVAQNVHNVHPIQQHALPSKFLKISSNYRIRCCKIVLDSMLPYLVVYVRMLLKGNSHFPLFYWVQLKTQQKNHLKWTHFVFQKNTQAKNSGYQQDFLLKMKSVINFLSQQKSAPMKNIAPIITQKMQQKVWA